MDFTGWLWETYASPFSLLDGYISTGRFSEFVRHFVDKHDESVLWDIYLHKLGAWSDESWDDFKSRNTRRVEPDSGEVVDIVDESFTMLESFKP